MGNKRIISGKLSMILWCVAHNDISLSPLVFTSLLMNLILVPGIHTTPAQLELQLGQHHAHILPTPLVPGVIDSDSVNDGGGKDEISEWYRVDAAQLNDTYNLRW